MQERPDHVPTIEYRVAGVYLTAVAEVAIGVSANVDHPRIPGQPKARGNLIAEGHRAILAILPVKIEQGMRVRRRAIIDNYVQVWGVSIKIGAVCRGQVMVGPDGNPLRSDGG